VVTAIAIQSSHPNRVADYLPFVWYCLSMLHDDIGVTKRAPTIKVRAAAAPSMVPTVATATNQQSNQHQERQRSILMSLVVLETWPSELIDLLCDYALEFSQLFILATRHVDSYDHDTPHASHDQLCLLSLLVSPNEAIAFGDWQITPIPLHLYEGFTIDQVALVDDGKDHSFIKFQLTPGGMYTIVIFFLRVRPSIHACS
jgi:hypothetical protein